ncbi:MAG TPA: O-acetyl-ADP-ribose deacetylase [Bryobacteraceae bacterium]|nr:O-acetyl-ADP-ribose deacetylase [Bryobacteraceae bacterium]
MELSFPNGSKLELMQGDITRVPVDAIANAANSGLRGGGGVDGAIHAVGGPAIMQELDRIRKKSGGCPTGRAVATGAGRLPAKYVFHAVGPIFRNGRQGEPELLASAYRACLQQADEHEVASLSFPSISTGIYGYPVEQAARIAVEIVREHLTRGGSTLRRVVFVLFDSRTLAAYQNALAAPAG